MDLVRIVRHHLFLVVTRVDPRFENFHLLLCQLRALEPAYEFFGLAREHASANDLDPAFAFIGINGVLEKHNTDPRYYECKSFFTTLGDTKLLKIEYKFCEYRVAHK